MGKKIDGKEFREFGYLQEANRAFFHPLGLALFVDIHDDGTETIGGVYDMRDDPEGYAFADLSDSDSVEKSDRVDGERDEKAKARIERFGWVRQPIGTVVK